MSDKLTRRQFLVTSAATLTGLAAAACGAPPTAAPVPPTSAPVPPTATEAAAAPASTAVPPTPVPAPTAAPPPVAAVEMTVMFPESDNGKQVYGLFVDGFNKQMTAAGKPWQFKVNVGPATSSDFTTKVVVDAAAGTLADVVRLYATDYADFSAAGYLADLTPMAQAWNEWTHFYPVLRDLVTINGKVYGMPNANTVTPFYRKDILQTAGIPTAQPNTWADFYAICDQIATKTKAKPCGFPAGTAWGGGAWGESFKMIWPGFEGTVYDEKDKKWVVSSPNLLKTFQVYETLAKNKWLTVDELMTPNPWEPIKYQEFPQGKCLVVTGGDWQWTNDWGPKGQTPIDGLFEKVDRWMFPAENGKAYPFVAAGGGDSISAKAKSVDGAWEFLKYMYSVDTLCAGYAIYIGAPTMRDDTADKCPLYKTMVNGKMLQANSYFPSGRFLRGYPGENKISDAVGKTTESVILLKQTADQAMASFAKMVTDSLGADAVKTA